MTYLITFACYGCHLHGDESGSVDRNHNLPGSRAVQPDSVGFFAEKKQMQQPAYRMDDRRREVVLAVLRERCIERGWRLWTIRHESGGRGTAACDGFRPNRVSCQRFGYLIDEQGDPMAVFEAMDSKQVSLSRALP